MWYFLLLLFGAAAGFFTIFAVRREENKIDLLCGYLFQLIGMAFGAKFFYVLTDLQSLRMRNIYEMLQFLLTGFSFYGAIAGGMAAFYLYCRIYKLPFQKMSETFVFSYPVIYAVARVGCFLTGCCYGIPYQGIFCIVSRTGVNRFPVQLLESLCSLIVLGVMLLARVLQKSRDERSKAQKPIKEVSLVTCFLTLHATGRFFLEFLRDGGSKSMLGELSVNQWVSLGVIVICVCRFLHFFRGLKFRGGTR